MSVWVWLIVAALLILLEAVTFDFILGWFAVGSIFACIMAIIGTPVWAQVLVCVMTGLIFMVLFRKYLLNLALNLKNDKIKKYALGKTGRVVKVITRDMLFLARFEKRTFLVMLRDPAVLSVGASVKVVDAVEGVAIAIPDGLQNPQDEHIFTPQPLFENKDKKVNVVDDSINIKAASDNIYNAATFIQADDVGADSGSTVAKKRGRPVGSKNKPKKTAATKMVNGVAKKRGRPVGSKNKTKKTAATNTVNGVAKKRGRPVGSKNKTKNTAATKTVNEVAKKRGRPAGSKNKGKSQRLMAAEAAKDVRKKRGRPKGSKNRSKV